MNNEQIATAVADLVWAATERDKKNRIRQFDEFIDKANEVIAHLRQSSAPAAVGVPEGWVSVEDRMPEEYKRVLILKDCGAGTLPSHAVAYLDDDEWRYDAPGGESIRGYGYRATHWMPLPAAPSAGNALPADDTCQKCNGSGEIPVLAGYGEDTYEELGACNECSGTGAQPAAPDSAAAPAAIPDRLTPLDQLPGYDDKIVYGKYSVRDYHVAINGEGPRAYDWKDKPHRLVYDLCRALLEQRLAAHQPPAQDGGEVPMPEHPEGYKFSAPGVSKIDVWAHGGKWYPLYSDKQLRAYGDARAAAALASAGKPSGQDAIDERYGFDLWWSASGLVGFKEPALMAWEARAAIATREAAK